MHCNLLKVLEEANILKNIKRICGASAGSIIALLFAVGYSTKEMKEIMFNSNLTKKSTGLLLRPIVSKPNPNPSTKSQSLTTEFS